MLDIISENHNDTDITSDNDKMNPRINNIIFIASWLVTLVWTTILVYLLMKPGTTPLPAQSFFVSFFRLNFSRAELVEAVAHVGMFGSLTVLWWWTLINHYPSRYAVSATVLIVALLGTATEFGQFFVARSSVALDLGANFAGIMLALVCLRFFPGNLLKKVGAGRCP